MAAFSVGGSIPTDLLLISCYDRNGGPNVVHPLLSGLLDGLQGAGCVKLTEFADFTDKWFDEIESDFGS